VSNARIQGFEADGTFVQVLLPDDGVPLSSPYGVAPLADGGAWVADSYNHRLVRFDAASRVLDRVGGFGTGTDGFDYPLGLAWDASRERLWVADSSNGRVVAWGWGPLP